MRLNNGKSATPLPGKILLASFALQALPVVSGPLQALCFPTPKQSEKAVFMQNL